MRNHEVRIVFLGASIIEGWRTVAGPVWERVLEPAFALNLGVPGGTSGMLMWRVQNGLLRGLQPHTVVLQVGANDLDVPADGVAQNIRDTITALQEQIPGVRTIVFGIFPTDAPGSRIRTKNEQTNTLLRALDDGDRVRVADCGHLFVDSEGRTVPDLLPDGLHLSLAAYEKWAEVLLPMLNLNTGP